MDNPAAPIPSISPQPAKSPNRRWLLWSAIGLTFLALGIALGIFSARFLNQSQSQPQLPPTPTPTLSPILSPAPDLNREPAGSAATADWKTYDNDNANLSFKYPLEMSELLATEGGVSGPVLGNANLVVSFADKSTVHLGTDAPFDGFSVYEIEATKLGMSFDSYINKEVEAVKSSPRGTSTATAVKTSIGNQNFTYIDSETTIKRYFILSPDNKRIAIFSRVNSTAGFLNTFDQILSTFQFSEVSP